MIIVIFTVMSCFAAIALFPIVSFSYVKEFGRVGKTNQQESNYPSQAIVEGFEDVEYFEISRQDDRIILKPLHTIQSDKVRDKLNAPRIKEGDMGDAIQYARRKS